ncbi:3-oxoacyl-ACP reductase FabG [Gilvimarinus agarilyticus]|uniref:3-oxoacyl-ACP reductase FabG n=1 Tax=Reichenbachiella agariperforans TaxID=156994 RepID=UPI001C09721E|nr:3-oxoacyl-ACP reductase FabG [Reichenbachiella agariperforans]MBU2884846.1 3-oxoacyl-ACP reductase FabG [Gilvimarinus agarilyticus]MBU2913016.1 3-oxoacyl-ACP reductase FabG [Reichenbachiella agariperforans]
MKKCALVTGGSRGIGRAVAVALAADLGLHVIINYASNDDAANETKRLIEEKGGTAELLKFQVQDHAEVEAKLSTWLKNNPESKVHVLVNNAGITRDNLMVFMEESDFDDVVQTSLKGMYNVTRHLLQHFVRNRSGRIINMASLSGLKGVPGQVNYSAAKGGMIAATKALAQEVAKRKITVNAVAPGFITSDMTEDLNEDELKKLVPMNRFGQVQEVADLVSFLASDKAAYITGEVININGGLYS